MESLIRKIDNLVETLTALKPIKAEYKSVFDQKIRLEFSYNSNHIEGNTLTYGETKLLLLFDKTTGNHDLREYEEMKAHDVAFDMIKSWATETHRNISETDIKNLHEILLIKPFWKEAQTPDGNETRRLIKVGAYKEFPNSVRLQNGEIFHYASPIDTPILMGELLEWYSAEETKNELHPVALAALFHYKFVRIHPFDDGNGRISRLIMNYVLLRHNLPPIIIKTSDKKNFLFALNQADAGDLNAFIKYIAEQLLWSLELSLKAAKGESLEEPDDLDKEISVWKKGVIPNLIKTPRRNNNIILNLFENCLNQLTDKFISSHRIFSELFIKTEVEEVVNGKYYENPKIVINTLAEHAHDNYVAESYLEDRDSEFWLKTNPEKYFQNDQFSDYILSIKFKELKLEKNYLIQSNLKVIAKLFEYQIYNNDEFLIKKNYDQFLTEGEIDQIVKTCVKTVFEEIKAKSKN